MKQQNPEQDAAGSHSAITDRQILDRLLNPLRETLTPEASRAIAALRADAATQEHLAERHHEGQLSDNEIAEYQFS